ncbi:MAG: ATP-dependent DNA helicase [Succinivibrionaceae bacterium]|nr:ATP-dependent DNA helicase [Succinivibrionaceae bacterium]
MADWDPSLDPRWRIPDLDPSRPQDPRGPQGRRLSLDPATVLGPHGPLASKIENFTPREGQQRLAAAVESALSGGRHLVAEAGTGTGKTFAYLVPLIISGRSVIVSTSSKALQDQLVGKDLPLLYKVLGLERDYMVLKGSQNYACLLRYEELKQKNSQTRLCLTDDSGASMTRRQGPGEQEMALITEIVDGALDDLKHGRPGCTFGEVGSRLPPALAEQVTIDPNQCPRHRCPHYEECLVMAARRHARECRVVVVNHSLFFSDFAIRGAAGAGEEQGEDTVILPDYGAIVFDEAHTLAAAGRDHLGTTLSQLGMRRLMALIQDAVGDSDRPEEPRLPGMMQAVEGPFLALGMHFRTLLNELGQARLRMREVVFPDPGRPTERDERFLTPAREAYRALGDLYALLRDACVGDDPRMGRVVAMVAQARQALLDAIACGGGLLSGEANPSLTAWVEIGEEDFGLVVCPIEIDAPFGAYLSALTARGASAIFTSATISVDRAFAKFERELGMAGTDPLELVVDSTFSYGSHSALLVSASFPPVGDRGREALIIDALAPVIESTEGRGGVFFLTTSVRALRAAHECLARRYGERRLVLAQGQGESVARLLTRFKADGHAILVGTSSFWAGVDVPGEALSLVIIDKLPFAPPTDPLVQARCERYDRAGDGKGHRSFNDITLMEAVIELRQGVGRLIRNERDRGAMVICDPRLATGRYRARFLDNLPPMRRFGLGADGDLGAALQGFGACFASLIGQGEK